MMFSGNGKLRPLYLLALAQLVGGPLMLLHVTWFCKMTLHEAPKVGMAQAAHQAWYASVDLAVENENRSRTPEAPPRKFIPEKPKLPVNQWETPRLHLQCESVRHEPVHRERIWTPAWPKAPPGPPPRVG